MSEFDAACVVAVCVVTSLPLTHSSVATRYHMLPSSSLAASPTRHELFEANARPALLADDDGDV